MHALRDPVYTITAAQSRVEDLLLLTSRRTISTSNTGRIQQTCELVCVCVCVVSVDVQWLPERMPRCQERPGTSESTVDPGLFDSKGSQNMCPLEHEPTFFSRLSLNLNLHLNPGSVRSPSCQPWGWSHLCRGMSSQLNPGVDGRHAEASQFSQMLTTNPPHSLDRSSTNRPM